GRRLLEALGEAALELSGQLEEGRVEVRFAGSDPELVLVRDEAEPALEATDEAYTARISLRLPESLKVRLEAAAASDGVSVNTWLVHAIRHVDPIRGVRRPSSGGSSRRLTGYGRS
ncbi:MAG: hypothetical protein QOE36_1140, partial [Gaiellaceae bacterium]|nr:hypothetical protein [Gaiellaceae bacterium]